MKNGLKLEIQLINCLSIVRQSGSTPLQVDIPNNSRKNIFKNTGFDLSENESLSISNNMRYTAILN